MSRGKSWRPGLCAALAVFLLAAPGAASATTVGAGEFQGELAIAAGPGEVNNLRVDVRQAGGAGRVVVRDRGAPLHAGSRCHKRAGGEAICRIPGLAIVFVELGGGGDALAVHNRVASVQFTIGAQAGDDRVRVGRRGEVCLAGGAGADRLSISTPSGPCIVQGGKGNDRLRGSSGQDRLYGDDGDDVVRGGAGQDYVSGDDGADSVHGGADGDPVVDGGRGRDRLAGDAGPDAVVDGRGDDVMAGGRGRDILNTIFYLDGSGDDTIRGGPGIDSYSYLCPSCGISLDGRANDGRTARAERDNVNVEQVTITSHTPGGDEVPPRNFGTGADVLVGDDGANALRSQRGDDLLAGRGGHDRLFAGTGDDLVRAADGVADVRISCGPGDDRAIVDAADSADPDCETVVVS